jgi:hypothetical protein
LNWVAALLSSLSTVTPNADWGTLMALQWDFGRRQPTHVYGPTGTEDMLQGFLAYFKPSARIRMADSQGVTPPEKLFHAHDYKGNGEVHRDDLITVTAAENCQPRHPRQRRARQRVPGAGQETLQGTSDCGT